MADKSKNKINLHDEFDKEQAPVINLNDAFDSEPTNSFEGIDLGAQQFDPEQSQRNYLSETLEGAGAGALQGVTFGLADEISAAVQAGIPLPGSSSEQLDGYRNARDESRDYFAAQQAKNPYAYPVGQVGGTLASSVIPGVGIAPKGAGVLGQALQAATAAGLQGAGQSQAELANPGSNEPVQFAKDTLIPAASAAVLAGTLPTIAKDMAPATKIGINPTTGISNEVTDLKKLLSQLGKSSLKTGATGAAIGAMTNPEDPLDGGVMGAALGAAIGPILRTGIGSGRALSQTKLGEKARVAYQLGKKGSLLSGSKAENAVAKQFGQVQSDLSDLVNKEIVQKGGDAAYAKIDKVTERIKNFVTKGKEIKGKQIEQVVASLADSPEGLNVGPLADNILSDISTSVEAGLIDETKIKGLRSQLEKLKQITQPDLKATTTNRVQIKRPAQMDLLNPDAVSETLQGPSTIKIAGNEISADELKMLQDQAVSQKLGNASITETTNPTGTLTKQTTNQQQVLGQAPILRNDVSIDELIKTKNLIGKGINSTDPNQRALMKRAYGKMIEDLTSRLDDPKAQKLYKDLRSEYSNLIKLDDATLQQGLSGQLEPSRAVEKAVEGYSKPGIGRQKEDLSALLDLVNKSGGSTETANRLKAQAAVASRGLQDAQSVGGLTTPQQLGKQFNTVNNPIAYESSGLKKVMDRLKDVSPEEAIKIEQRVKDVASKAEVIGESEALRGHTGLDAQSVQSRLLGAPEQALMKGSNILGYLKSAASDPSKIANIAVQAERKGFGPLGSILRNARLKDRAGRAAVLFTIQQNPAYREQLLKLEPQDEQDTESDFNE